jgi:hypothetical protein
MIQPPNVRVPYAALVHEGRMLPEMPMVFITYCEMWARVRSSLSLLRPLLSRQA